MDEQERQRLFKILETTRGELKSALAGVPRKLLLWSPAPGKWSIQEIVCHMRDMEREAYLARYRRILAEEDPSLPDVDGDMLALERDYRAQKLGEVVRDWARARGECLKLLKKVKGERWSRRGTHETAGPLSMDDFLRRQAIGNDQAHLGQIQAVKKRGEALTRLEAGPAALAEATRGLTDETVRRRPESDKWSIVEIACHMRDAEKVFAERFTKIAHQDRPALWMMDNDRLAQALRYREADLAAAVKDYRRLREGTLMLLRALPHPVWGRTGRHPRRGEVSIERLAEILANHDEGHLGRIRALR